MSIRGRIKKLKNGVAQNVWKVTKYLLNKSRRKWRPTIQTGHPCDKTMCRPCSHIHSTESGNKNSPSGKLHASKYFHVFVGVSSRQNRFVTENEANLTDLRSFICLTCLICSRKNSLRIMLMFSSQFHAIVYFLQLFSHHSQSRASCGVFEQD